MDAAGGERMVYHDPCHLLNVMGIKREPRELLRDRGELVEIPGGANCCGMGGVFAVVEPALSAALGNRRAEGILSASPDLVVTGCPGCMLQLEERLAAMGKPLPVRHTLEMLCRSTGPRAAALG